MNILYWEPGRYMPAATHGDVAAFAQRQRDRIKRMEKMQRDATVTLITKGAKRGR